MMVNGVHFQGLKAADFVSGQISSNENVQSTLGFWKEPFAEFLKGPDNLFSQSAAKLRTIFVT